MLLRRKSRVAQLGVVEFYNICKVSGVCVCPLCYSVDSWLVPFALLNCLDNCFYSDSSINHKDICIKLLLSVSCLFLSL